MIIANINCWLRNRPLLNCRMCYGHGGDMDFIGEWSECPWCYYHWDDCVDHGMERFEGKVRLAEWVRQWLTEKMAAPGVTLTSAIKCKMGMHAWGSDFNDNKIALCRICWKNKKL